MEQTSPAERITTYGNRLIRRQQRGDEPGHGQNRLDEMPEGFRSARKPVYRPNAPRSGTFTIIRADCPMTSNRRHTEPRRPDDSSSGGRDGITTEELDESIRALARKAAENDSEEGELISLHGGGLRRSVRRMLADSVHKKRLRRLLDYIPFPSEMKIYREAYERHVLELYCRRAERSRTCVVAGCTNPVRLTSYRTFRRCRKCLDDLLIDRG